MRTSEDEDFRDKGNILSDLAIDNRTKFDIEYLRLKRFNRA